MFLPATQGGLPALVSSLVSTRRPGLPAWRRKGNGGKCAAHHEFWQPVRHKLSKNDLASAHATCFYTSLLKVSESVLTSNPGRSSSFGFQFGLHKTSRLASLAQQGVESTSCTAAENGVVNGTPRQTEQKREWWQVRSTSRVLATTPLIKI